MEQIQKDHKHKFFMSYVSMYLKNNLAYLKSKHKLRITLTLKYGYFIRIPVSSYNEITLFL